MATIITNQSGEQFITNGFVAIPLSSQAIDDLFNNANVGFDGVENLEDVNDWTAGAVHLFCVNDLGYSSVRAALADGAITEAFAGLYY